MSHIKIRSDTSKTCPKQSILKYQWHMWCQWYFIVRCNGWVWALSLHIFMCLFWQTSCEINYKWTLNTELNKFYFKFYFGLIRHFFTSSWSKGQFVIVSNLLSETLCLFNHVYFKIIRVFISNGNRWKQSGE